MPQLYDLPTYLQGNITNTGSISHKLDKQHAGADPDRGESGLSHGQIFPLGIFRG